MIITLDQAELTKLLQQAYRAGRESILAGACTGTSLDDSHMDDAIADILKDHLATIIEEIVS